jgi:large subunit ribosomal protein L15
VNIGLLNVFDKGTEVTPDRLVSSGLVKSLKYPVKILADGQIDHPITVKANKFSASARAKIEAAGGTVEEVEYAAKVD